MRLRLVRSIDISKHHFPLFDYLLQDDRILKVSEQGRSIGYLPQAPDQGYWGCFWTSSATGLFARYICRQYDGEGILQIFTPQLSLRTVISEHGQVKWVEFDYTGKYISMIFKDRISVYQVSTGRRLWTTPKTDLLSCEFSRSSNYLIGVAGNAEGYSEDLNPTLLVWDTVTGQVIYQLRCTLEQHSDYDQGTVELIEKSYFVSDDNKPLFVSVDDRVVGYDLATGQEIWSTNGARFASGAMSDKLVVMSVNFCKKGWRALTF